MANRIDLVAIRKMGLVVVTGRIFSIKESVHELDTATYNNIMTNNVFNSI